MANVVLSASDVKKSFGKIAAVDSVSLQVFEGEIFGLLGSNGAGKSTLARIMVGLERADSGKIEYFGKQDSRIKAETKKRISFVPQDPAFYENFTVMQNIEFFASLYGISGTEAKSKAKGLIEWLNLANYSEKKAELLSGGYQRLLSIACSLVNNPEIIFLDEPTVGLDPKMRQLLWGKIRELKLQNRAIILTTHYMDEAQELCDRIAMMANGKIGVIDSPDSLIEQFGGETQLVFKLNKPVAQDLLAKAKAALPEASISSDESTLFVSVQQRTVTRSIVEMSNAIKEMGYEIRTNIVKEPEMDDVFLHFTGSAIK